MGRRKSSEGSILEDGESFFSCAFFAQRRTSAKAIASELRGHWSMNGQYLQEPPISGLGSADSFRDLMKCGGPFNHPLLSVPERDLFGNYFFVIDVNEDKSIDRYSVLSE